MRAFLLLMMLMFALDSLNAKPPTETLIRRAYIDMLGVPPTITEIEWYVVYNPNNSYELAVEHVINRTTKLDPILCKTLLNSSLYIELLPRALTLVESKILLVYNAGLDIKNLSDEQVKLAKHKLVEFAQQETSNVGDGIDYLCNVLMSRSTNVNEANDLLKQYSQVESIKGEQQAWFAVLESILLLPDVVTK